MNNSAQQNSPKFPFFFMLVSIVCVAGIYFFISHYVSKALSDTVKDSTEKANAMVTKIFINEVYPDLHEHLKLTYDRQQALDKLAGPSLSKVDERVRAFMQGTDILKVKIYNVKGITVYSSEAAQIGQDKDDNAGFNNAMRGSLVTQVTYRGKFSAFDGEVFDRNLIASYVPVYDKNKKIIGVAEIYTDRSSSIAYTQDMLANLQAVLVPSLALVLFFIALISWRIFQVAASTHIENLQNLMK